MLQLHWNLHDNENCLFSLHAKKAADFFFFPEEGCAPEDVIDLLKDGGINYA